MPPVRLNKSKSVSKGYDDIVTIQNDSFHFGGLQDYFIKKG
jgi:hypothetical protein